MLCIIAVLFTESTIDMNISNSSLWTDWLLHDACACVLQHLLPQMSTTDHHLPVMFDANMDALKLAHCAFV